MGETRERPDGRPAKVSDRMGRRLAHPSMGTSIEVYNFKNTGDAKIIFGGAAVPDRTNHTTGLTNGTIALRLPKDSALSLAYVCISPDGVEVDALGRAAKLTIGSYVLAQLDEAASVYDSVGTEADTGTFVHDIPGFQVGQYLGDYFTSDPAQTWALITPDVQGVLCKAVAAEAGGTIDLNTVDEDGNVSGKDFTVNVAG